MEKFKGKYRIESSRLKNWDYGSNAAYFVTICTKNQRHYFGEITNGLMQLSEIGLIVENEWLKTFQMRPDMNLLIDEYVVMPNHFHAIIIIGESKHNTLCKNAVHCVSTNGEYQNKFGPPSKNLASIIRGFKIGVTKNASKIDSGFAWQARFHDHIIRNDAVFQRISDYIKNNPMMWLKDKFH